MSGHRARDREQGMPKLRPGGHEALDRTVREDGLGTIGHHSPGRIARLGLIVIAKSAPFGLNLNNAGQEAASRDAESRQLPVMQAPTSPTCAPASTAFSRSPPTPSGMRKGIPWRRKGSQGRQTFRFSRCH
jgi:hypothetical protein